MSGTDDAMTKIKYNDILSAVGTNSLVLSYLLTVSIIDDEVTMSLQLA